MSNLNNRIFRAEWCIWDALTELSYINIYESSKVIIQYGEDHVLFCCSLYIATANKTIEICLSPSAQSLCNLNDRRNVNYELSAKRCPIRLSYQCMSLYPSRVNKNWFRIREKWCVFQ
ncbi:hypothetical protein V1478_004314 [Vespula squamosa]|uniref:Uncharacterized protein n=1 Tax=Vespula squamosa TaxID=30214 RepID=A0ABD2BHS7_VESSQ